MTRIAPSLPHARDHCRIFIAKTQTCLQALSLVSAYNTLHSAQRTHFQLLRKKCILNLASLKFYQNQIRRGRQSNKGPITNILQMCFRKICNSDIFLQRKLFQRKKSKKAKSPKNVFRQTNLR